MKPLTTRRFTANEETYRQLTVYEEACRINFAERDGKWEKHVKAVTEGIQKEIVGALKSVIKQVEQRKILTLKKRREVRKLSFKDKDIKKGFERSFIYLELEGRLESRNEIENSVGKRLKFGIQESKHRLLGIEEISPTEAFDKFGKRVLLTKAEYETLQEIARTRACTVAGVMREDILE